MVSLSTTSVGTVMFAAPPLNLSVCVSFKCSMSQWRELVLRGTGAQADRQWNWLPERSASCRHRGTTGLIATRWGNSPAAFCYNDSWARVVKFLGAAPHAFEPSAADTVIIHQSRPTLASVRNADEVRATLEAACRNQRDREAHAHVAADILVVCDELQREYGAFPEAPPAAGYVAT